MTLGNSVLKSKHVAVFSKVIITSKLANFLRQLEEEKSLTHSLGGSWPRLCSPVGVVCGRAAGRHLQEHVVCGWSHLDQPKERRRKTEFLQPMTKGLPPCPPSKGVTLGDQAFDTWAF